MPKLPIEALYVVLAAVGGAARYLVGYTREEKFKLSIFAASIIISGFSGYMFALLGISLNLPPAMLFMMAGTGGFFGEQTMKLVLDYVKTKTV